MTVTISRLFDDYATASKVVRDLEAAGIPHSDISIVSNNADNWYTGDRPGKGGTTGRVDRDRDGVDNRAEGAGAGAGIGAAVGLVGGALIGDQMQKRQNQDAAVQQQIQTQQAEIDRQQRELNALKAQQQQQER
jgi:Glycine zipper